MKAQGISEEKLSIIHNFSDPILFQRPFVADKSSYYLYFGRIEKLKGVETLIQAFKKTGRTLKVAGTGSWKRNLLESIAGNDNIEYVGFQSGAELAALVQHARAVVVPSEWYENCPMSVIEAKALGTPVIGSNIGGIPELINPGSDGTIFEPGNADSLNEAVELIEMGSSLEQSKCARQDALMRFSSDQHLKLLLQEYEEVRALV